MIANKHIRYFASNEQDINKVRIVFLFDEWVANLMSYIEGSNTNLITLKL